MPDREKVIRELEQAKGEINPISASRKVRLRDAVDDAIAMLKEQEARLVEIDGQLGGIKYGCCPKCGKGLNEEVYPHWCGFCGQAVKWK